MELSIIVPIYNVEKYLNRCIDSLLNQKVGDYEIILIDDESPDDCGIIADEYAKKYKNILVIHQNNKGLAGARNTGLRKARGEYILFVDSDDWVKPNSIDEILYEAKKNNLDVGVLDFQEVHEDGRVLPNLIKPILYTEVVSGEFFFLDGIKKKSLLKCVWKSIYRRKFLLENKLFFREGYNHEDEEWTPRVYLRANRIMSIEKVFYCYFIRSQSISKNSAFFAKNSYDLISNCYKLKELSFTINNQELRMLFQNDIVGLFLSAFYKGKLIDKKYSKLVNSSFFKDIYYDSTNKKKVTLFKISKKIYYYINYLYKHKNVKS